MLQLCAAWINRLLLSTSQLNFIKMASSSGTALQESWPSSKFQSLMKVSTSVPSLVAENHRTAGCLSQVRRLKSKKETFSHSRYNFCLNICWCFYLSVAQRSQSTNTIAQTCCCVCIKNKLWFLFSTVFKLGDPNIFTPLLCMLCFLWWVSASRWLWCWLCWCCCSASGGTTKVSLFLKYIC